MKAKYHSLTDDHYLRKTAKRMDLKFNIAVLLTLQMSIKMGFNEMPKFNGASEVKRAKKLKILIFIRFLLNFNKIVIYNKKTIFTQDYKVIILTFIQLHDNLINASLLTTFSILSCTFFKFICFLRVYYLHLLQNYYLLS